MLILTILMGLIVLLLTYVYYVQRFSRLGRKINMIRGPDYLPVIGNLMDIHTTPVNIFKTFRGYTAKYKKSFRVWIGHMAIVNITNAEDAEIILTSTKHIKKSRIYSFVHQWLGTGLLTSTGQKWQQRRKLLTPSFHFNILRKFTLSFGEHAQQLVEELKKECDKPQTNVGPLIATTTLNAICETAMGTSLDPTDKIHKGYFESIHQLAGLTVYRIMSPWLFNNFIFSLSSTGRKTTEIVTTLHKFTSQVIKEREANFKESDVENLEKDDDVSLKKKRLAMLDLLISAKKKNQAIDDNGIREEVDTFMFEGHDTTSSGIAFALMMLANQKEHQEKIAEELKELFGNSNRPATYEDLQNMPYLELCLKECLRMFPSVPLIGRFLEEDLQLSTCLAPAGTTINLHIYDLHYDERYFPNPKKFDPDRFLPENATGRHPFAYIPFSAGPRNCIGQKFAMLEMKSIISAILRNYVLEPVDTQETMRLKLDFVLRNEGEINVRFRPRK